VTKVASPLTPQQAARIEPLGLLADEPSGLLAAWNTVEGFWADTVAQARLLGAEQLSTRVNGEWSFVETLRHLINVTDAWIGDLVLEKRSPYDPIGLPPDFFTPGPELGLDLNARPSLADVLDRRSTRMAEARDAIAQQTVGGLDRLCGRFDGQFTVLGAFQNVIFEEWAHHFFAVRDLAAVR
jgi:DinB superfamily